ncbi:MAG: hypothetical protein KF784_02180 [Fimbriimonadaceae bacterium]|nr:hypothetical protein [Fimbriimonadaceae bacterium]
MLLGILIAASAGFADPGDIAGQVSIGPLTPVQKVGEPEPPIPPELLKACKVIVTSSDGKTVVAKIALKHKGFFRSKLAPGEYLAHAELANAPNRMNDPVKVVIKAGETTRIELHADTGIR